MELQIRPVRAGRHRPPHFSATPPVLRPNKPTQWHAGGMSAAAAAKRVEVRAQLEPE